MRLARFEHATEWRLTGLAVVFLAAHAWPILDPAVPGGLAAALSFVTVFVWVLFGGDYATRVYLAADRWAFVPGTRSTSWSWNFAAGRSCRHRAHAAPPDAPG